MILPRIIAICGQKRCGKDTLANYIAETYNYEHIKISSTLKSTLKVLFGFSDEQLEYTKDIIDKKWGITPRDAMTFIGTEVMQYKIQELLPNKSKKFWIHRTIEEHIDKNPNKKYVISDLRFLHEFEELSKHDLMTVKIIRYQEKSDFLHISEKEFEQIPTQYVLENRKSKDELFSHFEKVLMQKSYDI